MELRVTWRIQMIEPSFPHRASFSFPFGEPAKSPLKIEQVSLLAVLFVCLIFIKNQSFWLCVGKEREGKERQGEAEQAWGQK